MTKYNPNRDPRNWTNSTYREDERTDKNQADQERILQNLDALSQKAANGLMRSNELKDFDLMTRINAASEGDNLENRVKVAKVEIRAEALS